MSMIVFRYLHFLGITFWVGTAVAVARGAAKQAQIASKASSEQVISGERFIVEYPFLSKPLLRAVLWNKILAVIVEMSTNCDNLCAMSGDAARP